MKSTVNAMGTLTEFEKRPDVQQKLAQAHAVIEAANAELRRCLLAGHATNRARDLVNESTAKAEKIVAALQAGVQEQMDARRAQWAADLERLDAEITAAIAARAAASTPPIPPPPGGTLMKDAKMPEISDGHRDAIRAAAAVVASADARHRRAAEDLRAAEGRLRVVETRIAAKASARDAIVSRRLAGDERSDDAAELALVDADREALTGLLDDAERVTAEQRIPAQAAAQALSAAHAQVRDAEVAAEIGAVVAYAGQLDRLLLDATRRLDALSGASGRRPAWGASRDLREILRRLALRRGEA
jgi:hypothetical protein